MTQVTSGRVEGELLSEVTPQPKSTASQSKMYDQ